MSVTTLNQQQINMMGNIQPNMNNIRRSNPKQKTCNRNPCINNKKGCCGYYHPRKDQIYCKSGPDCPHINSKNKYGNYCLYNHSQHNPFYKQAIKKSIYKTKSNNNINSNNNKNNSINIISNNVNSNNISTNNGDINIPTNGGIFNVNNKSIEYNGMYYNTNNSSNNSNNIQYNNKMFNNQNNNSTRNGNNNSYYNNIHNYYINKKNINYSNPTNNSHPYSNNNCKTPQSSQSQSPFYRPENSALYSNNNRYNYSSSSHNNNTIMYNNETHIILNNDIHDYVSNSNLDDIELDFEIFNIDDPMNTIFLSDDDDNNHESNNNNNINTLKSIQNEYKYNHIRTEPNNFINDINCHRIKIKMDDLVDESFLSDNDDDLINNNANKENIQLGRGIKRGNGCINKFMISSDNVESNPSNLPYVC